jgi:Transcriptional regulator, AbiEi antitoxin
MLPAVAPQPSADGPKCQPTVDISARRRSRWDAEIALIAGRQHGLISLEQLRRLGIDRRTVHQRVRAGRLHPVHDGVYAVGFPTLTRDRQLMAAVLACGPDAVLSHRSAAELWGFRPDGRDSVDITAPGRRGRSPRGIDAHRHSSLQVSDVTRVHGTPCTSVERTLLDLAALVPVWELRKAIAEAEVLRLLDQARLRRLIQRSRGRRGVARLRLVLDGLHPQTERTRSELERRFLQMCVRADLPSPEVNARLEIGGRWPSRTFSGAMRG